MTTTVDALAAAILTLHQPARGNGSKRRPAVRCRECGFVWPCKTAELCEVAA